MTTELKLCKDCKHHVRKDSSEQDYEFSKCLKTVKHTDMVSGKKEYAYCDLSRLVRGICKEEALLFEPIELTEFEPKLSLWYKLKNIFCKRT